MRIFQFPIAAAALAIAAVPLYLAAHADPTTPANDFHITEDRVGPISASTSAADLRRAFGAAHVIDKQLPGAEGQTVDGSIVDAGPANRVEVYWSDGTHTHVGGVRIATRGGKWQTAVGNIGVGTSLADLVVHNAGKPIRFSGFDWDYGGYISDWGNGPLAKAFGGKSHIRLRLGYAPPAKLSPSELKSVEGERKVSSTNPALGKLRPFVQEITVGF